jgi:GNAT superfamily N-acetyltransferase
MAKVRRAAVCRIDMRRASRPCGTIDPMRAMIPPASADLTFARVDRAAGADFAAFFAIYEHSLPRRERKDATSLRAMCQSADYRIVVAKKAGMVAGFFVLFVGSSIALLEYLAVRAELRGGGIGAALYRRARGEAGGRSMPLLIEIDSEREGAGDAAVRARRKSFYRGMGCRMIEDLCYVLPLPGEDAPALMDLLVDDPQSRCALAKQTVACWLSEVYTRVYGCAADDPRLLRTLDSLPEDIRLA